MTMRINKRLLFICIAIPILAGVVSALLTMNSMEMYAYMNKPPLSPQGWIFPVVWTILYILMGVSSYLVITSDAGKEESASAMKLYAYQLVVNFLWPTFFFNFEWYLFSALWLILLWVLVFFMIRRFSSISKVAAYMNIPYLIWLTFAGYLNVAVWLLNP